MISFEFTDKDYNIAKPHLLKQWIKDVINSHKKRLGTIQYIFGSDEYILDINKTYLQHDYYTDIITFDYCEGKTITGDIFVSLDRIIDNAKKLEISEPEEFHRVIIHGVLHLIGFKDKSELEAQHMRFQEDNALEILRSLK